MTFTGKAEVFVFVLWHVYKFSNWSTRRFVLPLRISLKVLYLSRPCRTFSLWILSIDVSFSVSLVDSRSCFNACKQKKFLVFMNINIQWLQMKNPVEIITLPYFFLIHTAPTVPPFTPYISLPTRGPWCSMFKALQYSVLISHSYKCFSSWFSHSLFTLQPPLLLLGKSYSTSYSPPAILSWTLFNYHTSVRSAKQTWLFLLTLFAIFQLLPCLHLGKARLFRIACAHKTKVACLSSVSLLGFMKVKPCFKRYLNC